MSSPRSITFRSESGPEARSQTRDRILEATRQLLGKGEAFAQLSIHRIVREAGVSRATFYLHFRTKRELIAALAGKETESWFTIAAPFLEDATADRGALEQTLALALQAWREHRPVLLGIIELAEYDQDTRDAWRETMHLVGLSLTTAIRKRRPTLPEDLAVQLGRLIAWAGERSLRQEAEEASPEADRRLVWAMAEMIWKSLSD